MSLFLALEWTFIARFCILLYIFWLIILKLLCFNFADLPHMSHKVISLLIFNSVLSLMGACSVMLHHKLKKKKIFIFKPTSEMSAEDFMIFNIPLGILQSNSTLILRCVVMKTNFPLQILRCE